MTKPAPIDFGLTHPGTGGAVCGSFIQPSGSLPFVVIPSTWEGWKVLVKGDDRFEQVYFDRCEEHQ